jgi:hypothetical protein
MYELRRGSIAKESHAFYAVSLMGRIGHQPEYRSVVGPDPDLKTGSHLFNIKTCIFFVYLYLKTTCKNFQERFFTYWGYPQHRHR